MQEIAVTAFHSALIAELAGGSWTTTSPPAQGIDQTLRARGERYGSFHEHARVTQLLKSAMTEGVNWCGMDPDMKEALEMIQHKIGRILNGDPQYHDSWHDIVGYAKLVADRISPQSGAR